MTKPQTTSSSNQRPYRVWSVGMKPENGELLQAQTGYEARKAHASKMGIDVINVMSRLIDA